VTYFEAINPKPQVSLAVPLYCNFPSLPTTAKKSISNFLRQYLACNLREFAYIFSLRSYTGQQFKPSFHAIFNCTHILNNIINSSEHSVLKNLALSYVSYENILSFSSIRRQLGNPIINKEQQDAAQFISAFINIYDPLKNALSHKLQVQLICSACHNRRIQITQNYIIQLNVPNETKQ